MDVSLCPIILFIYTKNWQHSPERLRIFPRMFGNIPRNITFPHSPRSLQSVPRSCIPWFIHSLFLFRLSSQKNTASIKPLFKSLTEKRGLYFMKNCSYKLKKNLTCYRGAQRTIETPSLNHFRFEKASSRFSYGSTWQSTEEDLSCLKFTF